MLTISPRIAVRESGIKIALVAVWLGFMAYILYLHPLDRSGTLPLIGDLVRGNWQDINSYLVAVFWFMGVWPMIYAALLFIDDKTQPFSAWMAFLTSNGAGAVGLLPYLIARRSNQEIPRNRGLGIKILDSRWYGISLVPVTFALLFYALATGDLGDYIRLFQESAFVHLITLDFALMWLLFPVLLEDDIKRRNIENRWLFRVAAIVPLLGALFYLCSRPLLPTPRK
jgi:hypothetical protein